MFGHRYLYPIQRFIVSNLLEGRDQIVILPTGAGKSLCFQLSSQLLRGVTVVVVPLLALLEDQLRQCRQAGLRAGALRGGQGPVERRRLAAELEARRIRLVYTTPESLEGRGATVLQAAPVAALVVDEAHCIAEWGPSFRPAYRRLGGAAERLGAASRTAFTATAGAAVLETIRRELFAGGPVSLVMGDPDRSNLRYRVLPVLSRDRALERLARTAHRPLLVFCRSRAAAEHSARMLRRRLGEGEVFFYHAGLEAGERAAVEGWFLNSRTGVLAATSAYGLGVNKPDIRTVVHREPALSPEAYLQEVGRGGRDGAVVQASLLAAPDDLLYAGAITDPIERARFLQMLRYARESRRCRRESLFGFLGHSIGACAGCDVCDRSAAAQGESIAEGLAEMRAVARRHSRRFSLRELTLFLAGASGYDAGVRGLEGLPGFGSLAGWELEDVQEALEMMQQAGELRVQRRGPWRGRVAAAAPPVMGPES